MTTYSKDEISSILHKGVATVSFKKVDGSDRIMECTLNVVLLEDVDMPVKKTDRVKTSNNDVLSVWDTTAKGWRSFRIKNVYNVETPQKNLDF